MDNSRFEKFDEDELNVIRDALFFTVINRRTDKKQQKLYEDLIVEIFLCERFNERKNIAIEMSHPKQTV